MSVRAYGQLFIQATAPGEAPVMVGSLWADTTNNALKQCTAVAPFTFASAGGLSSVTTSAPLSGTGTGGSPVTMLSSATAGEVMTSGGTGVAPTFQALPTAKFSRLYSNSGNTQQVAGGNVDTYDLASQLAAGDTLMVTFAFESKTQATASPYGVVTVTGSNTGISVSSGASLAAGSTASGTAWIRQNPFTSGQIDMFALGAKGGGVVTSAANGATSTFAGAWTIGLRMGAITSGGTGYWSWSIYRLAA